MGASQSKDPMAKENAKAVIQDTLSQHKVVVFSKTFCPYCSKAKAALSAVLSKDKFYVMEIENRSDMNELQDALLDITGGRSVPRVFIDGKFIGGGDDTAHKLKTGELEQLLKAAGAL